MFNTSRSMASSPACLSSDESTSSDSSCYTIEDFRAFDLLQHPVYILDIEKYRIYWANREAVKIWRADSLEALLARDLSVDLSEAVRYRLNELLERCKRGEVTKEHWTLYPNNIATTLMLTGTGVKIEDGRTAVLVEAELPDKETYQEASIRGVELLRHLHVAVLQFSLEGKLIYQNPEATNVFGSCSSTFQGMFVDGTIAKNISLSQVAQGNVFDAEVEHHTATGKRWFSTSLRGMKDPVTSQNIVFMIARDISDIVQARKEKAIAQFKSEFMSILSHDIRTPLHQIVGFMDLLETSTNLSKEQKSQIDMVQMSAASLMNMSENILDYSKMNSGKFEIHQIQFDLHKLLDGCIATVVQDAGEKGLRLERKIANDLPQDVIGDPYRLRQILLNLLGNAVKFTERGSVQISASMIGSNGLKGPAFRCEITDTGIGIETSKQSNLFDKYTQVSTTIARNYGGSGLGLAICKSLVELMEGRIEMQSQPGVGTTVCFEIPLKVHTEEQDLPVGQGCLVQETRPLRILVAEDNKINQKVIQAMLQRLGHSVAIAQDGQEAVEKVKDEHYDLILMDVQMPVKDGLDATRDIRNIGRTKSKLPIVGLTASFQPSELSIYLEAGMNSCLGKPAKLNSLKAAIAAAIRESRLHV